MQKDDVYAFIIVGVFVILLWSFNPILIVGLGLFFLVIYGIFRNKRPKPIATPRLKYEDYSTSGSQHPEYLPISDPKIAELTNLGFINVGKFFLNSGRLDFMIDQYQSDSGVYAFVKGSEILYIGKTKNLQSRMMEYRNLSHPDKTNEKVNDGLIYEKGANIFFLSSQKILGNTSQMKLGNMLIEARLNYHIIEPFLISKFQPRLNYEGVRD